MDWKPETIKAWTGRDKGFESEEIHNKSKPGHSKHFFKQESKYVIRQFSLIFDYEYLYFIKVGCHDCHNM